MATPTTIEVVYTFTAEEEDAPVRGNALATEDSEENRKQEDEIIARLEAGDIFAWFCAKVTASVTVNGETFEGTDYLGCCSYASKQDFMCDGYFEDMKAQALADLRADLERKIAVGSIARKALRSLFPKEVRS